MISKTEALISQIANIETTVTSNENEALLLENTLIKTYWPRYNILFKDDKSYPFLFLSEHEFPRLTIHRGPQNLKGEYFGPFSNVGSIRDILEFCKKYFVYGNAVKIFFAIEQVPVFNIKLNAVLHHVLDILIRKPIIRSVDLVKKFLSGKNTQVILDMQQAMDAASQIKEYEKAAHYRDQIQALKKVQQQQYVIKKDGNADAIAFTSNAAGICIGIISIRNGLVLGSKTFLQEITAFVSASAMLSSFVSQYYLAIKPSTFDYPEKIVVNEKFEDREWLQDAISQHLKHKLNISDSPRGIYSKWVEMARMNAHHVLQKHYAAQANYFHQLEAFQTAFKLPNLPRRIECFDVSHTMGEATVASCVVFGEQGPIKSSYRKFNIHDVFGDDYAALSNALTRHYTKIKENNDLLPDVLIIDGGKGQFNVAKNVLEQLQINTVFLLAIAKGVSRKPGLEEIYSQNHHEPITFDPASPALHFLQQIRDEAHRFAITAQRSKLAKGRRVSILETIPGIGKKRREMLLKYFAGLQGLKEASIEEISKVQGISMKLAKEIYQRFHE